eukprot:scaffold255774_cov19-Prasinocladus_malaysianus.AAC.1
MKAAVGGRVDLFLNSGVFTTLQGLALLLMELSAAFRAAFLRICSYFYSLRTLFVCRVGTLRLEHQLGSPDARGSGALAVWHNKARPFRN